MTNYFSRLANTTGLRVGADAARPAGGAPATQTADTPLAQTVGEGRVPPPFEQTTYGEPPPVTPSGDTAAPADGGLQFGPTSVQGESFAGRHAHAAPAARPAGGEGSRQPERATPPPPFVAKPRPAPFEESRFEFVPRAPVPTPSGETHRPSRGGHGSSLLGESPEESVARGDALTRALAPLGLLAETPQPARATPSSAGPPESPAQADVRNAYLREVVEWINAPTDEMTGTDLARDKSSRADATGARTDAGREPEVQDFSLSIGSISIVVEEPPKQTEVTARAQSPERGRGTSSPVETSRLRRHYIRGL
jgi:hypothetical protein